MTRRWRNGCTTRSIGGSRHRTEATIRPGTACSQNYRIRGKSADNRNPHRLSESLPLVVQMREHGGIRSRGANRETHLLLVLTHFVNSSGSDVERAFPSFTDLRCSGASA